MMIRDIFFIAIGYMSGSVLYANVFSALLKKGNIASASRDGNPGTANAYIYGGFLCGTLTLCGDILKGFLPVFLYLQADPSTAFAIVLAAPVIGHTFSVFSRFHGGKGIAVTFGCLAGLIPDLLPAAILAMCFIFFSIFLRISPHYYRTLAAYACTEVLLFVLHVNPSVLLGFTAILAVVGTRMLTSKEKKGSVKVELLWTH